MFNLLGHLQRFGMQQWRIQPTRLMIAMLAVSAVSPVAQATEVSLPVIPAVQPPLALAAAQSSHRFHQDHVLGTSLDLVLVGLNDAEADQVFMRITQEIDRLDQVLSVWREDSEISQLNQQRELAVSADLFAVIAACEQWRDQTCGAFSARLGGLLQQWQAVHGIVALESGDTGRQRDWQSIAQQLHHEQVVLDPASRVIQRPDAVQFAPDGLAKGYVIDRVMAVALAAQPQWAGRLAGLLVDIGGDIRVWGQAPRESGWQIGVRQAGTRADHLSASTVLTLDNQAVALSGRGARDWISSHDHAAHSHLFSPMTGQPLDQVEQAVVVAPNTADADALATALAAMDATQGLALVESLAGFEAQVSMTDGQQWQSSGWQNLLATAQPMQMQTVSSASAPPNTNVAATASRWPTGFQAVLELEIPKLAATNYRAPYVVVWITDAQKKLVRSLQVWGNDPKWLDTNYVWWRRYGRKMDLDSTAQPSRKPGQYRVVWDGKNNAGEQMPAGDYTIHVEAAREHGDHSYQSFPLKAEPKPSVQQRPAQQELGNLILRFDRVI
ncbi:MAG: DUF2271 domain-containing protein [Moraxellaceae bacterium]